MPRGRVRNISTLVFAVCLITVYLLIQKPQVSDFEGYDDLHLRRESNFDRLIKPLTAPLGISPEDQLLKAKQAAQKLLRGATGAGVGVKPAVPAKVKTALTTDKRGLYVLPENAKSLAVHPITALIDEAKEKQAKLKKKIKSITTLKDAVADYKAMTGGVWDPPRGFEKWYEFASSTKSITAPSLLSQAFTSVLPYLAYKGSTIRERLATLDEKEDVYWFEAPSSKSKSGAKWIIGGGGTDSGRVNDVRELVNPLIQYLPALLPNQAPLKMYFGIHDGPMFQTHYDILQGSKDLAAKKKLWNPVKLKALEAKTENTAGWSYPCPPDSALQVQTKKKAKGGDEADEDAEDEDANHRRSFIRDLGKTLDYCHQPQMMKQHGVLINNDSRDHHAMYPLIATCKTMHNSDVLGVPLDAVNETIQYIPWEQKSDSRLYWRGTLTGAFHNSWTEWRGSQRERMIYATNPKLLKGKQDIWVESSEGGLVLKSVDRASAAKAWFDIAPVGGAVQCDPGECEIVEAEFEYAERANKEDTQKYKYILDLDGNGWSSRFRRLLTGASLVFKSTLFPEWHSDILVPWFHYIPVQVDYSDAFDIMAYFAGDENSEKHDQVARNIARNGMDFAEKRWRWEDMQSYQLLLMLELQRALSDDRDAASYTV